MMYLENDIPKNQDLYMVFVKDLLEAVPSFRPSIEAASKLILTGQLYNSLKGPETRQEGRGVAEVTNV